MSEVLIPFIEDVTPSIYKSMPGIRPMGLDVGATKNGLEIVNNSVVTSLSVYGVYGSHFDGDVSDFIGSIVSEVNTSTSDTTNKKFGSASRAFSGTQYIQYADSSIWNVGSADFYFDFWIRFGELGVLSRVLGQTDSGTTASSTSVRLSKSAGNALTFSCYVGSTAYQVSTSAISDTNFHHVRMGRNGEFIYIELDGVVSSGVAITGTINNSSNKFCLGQEGEYTGERFVGNLDEFVLFKGLGMNTTNFTVPTSEWESLGYLLKSLTRLNLDRLVFPKIYKPANTKCQVDVLGASVRANTATDGGNTTITLDASASAVDGFYVGNTIVLKTLTGAGQSRVITGYVGSTKVATVATWTINPANLTTFEIFQTVSSNISPGFDFSIIDYTTYPTVNIICSIEKQASATASPSMGVPIVTSIEKDWESQAPVLSTNATTSYTTALSVTGRCRLDSVSSFTTAAGGIPWIRVTIDGVVVFSDLVVGLTGAASQLDFVLKREAGTSLLVEHKSAGAFSSTIAVSHSK